MVVLAAANCGYDEASKSNLCCCFQANVIKQAEKTGNRRVGRKFGVNEKLVRRKRKDDAK